MATTQMWAIVDRLDLTVRYIENEEKTIDQTLKYVSRNEATQDKRYVTCINCSASDPVASMMRTKKMFNDKRKRVAFHGTQSFKPGEVDADTAHEIGIKTVHELFGDQYEIVLTTHLDKEHIHNHILINSTSFIDGHHYTNSKADYLKMREVSDRICKEYGLSVIENPKENHKNISYKSVRSYINEIKNAMDDCLEHSISMKQFYENLLLKGYGYTKVEDMECIVHPCFEQPIPLSMLGKKYQDDSLIEAIEDKEYEDIIPKENPKVFTELYIKRKILFGLQKTYTEWLILIGVLPYRKPQKKYLSKEARKELKYLDKISKETELMVKHSINTIDDIGHFRNVWQKELDELITIRKQIQNKGSKCANLVEKQRFYNEAKTNTPRIKELRNRLKLLEDLENRSIRFDKQIQEIEQEQKKKKNKER